MFREPKCFHDDRNGAAGTSFTRTTCDSLDEGINEWVDALSPELNEDSIPGVGDEATGELFDAPRALVRRRDLFGQLFVE